MFCVGFGGSILKYFATSVLGVIGLFGAALVPPVVGFYANAFEVVIGSLLAAAFGATLEKVRG